MMRASTDLTPGRRGSTLIVVMLLVAIMLAAIAGAFLRTSAERRNALDAAAQGDAYTLALNGIDSYVAAVTTLPASLPDSQSFTYPGGRAVVTLRPVRLAASDTLLVLVSRGENTTNRYASDAAVASRTITQLVRWTGGTLGLPAGFISLAGVSKQGTSGKLSGVDGCATPPAPLPSIPGVAVPSMSASDPTAQYSGPTSPIDGDPDNAPVVLGTPGPTGTARDNVSIDWAGIKGRTALTPNYYYKTSVPTSGSWPSSGQLTATPWPVTFVDGNISLSNAQTGNGANTAHGILIVTGDVILTGNANWNGILLIGGNLTSNGDNTIQGAVLTNLNVITGGTPTSDDIANGNKLFQYNSCNVSQALQPFGSWLRLGNARMDNYPIY